MQRTTIRLYRESTERIMGRYSKPGWKAEPPYGSTERALKEPETAAAAIANHRTTIRLYRESTERPDSKQYVAGAGEPPYGSTERALKGQTFSSGDRASIEPPYGSTERALKGRQIRRSKITIRRTTIRLYRESTERRHNSYLSFNPPQRTTIRLYRESTERAV